MPHINIYRNVLATNRMLLCSSTQHLKVWSKKGKQLHSKSTQAIQLLTK